MIVGNVGKGGSMISVAIFSLLIVLSAPAQEKQLRQLGGKSQQRQSLSPAAAAAAAQNRSAGVPLAIALNLSPAQRRALRSLRESSKVERHTITQRVLNAQRALDRAIYLEDEAEVEAGIQEAAAAQAAAIRLRATSELKIRRLLTAEQLSIYREIRRQAQANRANRR